MSTKLKFWAIAIGFIIFLWLLAPDPESTVPSYMSKMPEGDGGTVQGELQQPPPPPPSEMYAGDAAKKLVESGAIPGLSYNEDAFTEADSAVPAGETPASFRTTKIKFQTKRGILPLIAGVADNEELRERGLMFFRTWPQQMHGVLFIFDHTETIAMWMKNTYLPLDIIFMNETGKIVHIAENTTPLSEATISSQQPARLVLEIPAGAARKWQLNVGDNFVR